MRFEFVVRSGKDTGRVVALDTGQTIGLGRLNGSDLTVDDEAASRRHCTITARENLCVLADLQSANGTFVNERRVATTELAKGDRIRIGSTVIELIDAGAPGPSVRHDRSTTSLSLVDASGQKLVQRSVDPTKLEFLSQIHRHEEQDHLLALAQKYLTTLHKVSDILSRASSVETLFDSILSAVLEVSGSDRAAILMRSANGAGNDVDLVAARTRDGGATGAVTLSRTVVNDVLEKGISVFTNDALADERYVAGKSIVQQQIRAVMCAPMRTTDTILGVLYVDSKVAHDFNEAELELLAAVGNQAGIALHRARLVTEVERLFLDVMKAIASIIDAKDGYTHKHSERVAAFGVRLAHQLGFDADTRAVVELSGLLHDVGKIGVPDAILDKPGKLTDDEYSVIKKHPEHTHAILARVGCFAPIADLASSHHERLDGRGYHRGRRQGELSQQARIICVADICDALRQARPYREGLSTERIIEILRGDTRTGLDMDCVNALEDVLLDAETPLCPAPARIVESLSEDYHQAA